jgi:sugar lactone lactonase YvrE
MKILKQLSILFITLFLTFGVSDAQNIFTYAGTGVQGYSGDGGLAINGQLATTYGIAVDALGNVYIADAENRRIRKINTAGIISTIAGTGVPGFSGDGGAATSAQLDYPVSLAVDTSGNLYVGDFYRIRKVNASGIISTIAGTGVAGFSGDGGLAISAQIQQIIGISIDVSGNVYFADANNQRIRKINTAGIISTVAGTGVPGFSGDGGAATSAQITLPYGIVTDALGNLFISENFRIRKVNTVGIISTVAGTGVPGYSGDGGAAINAQFYDPKGIAIDSAGNIFIADEVNVRIRKINNVGIISTFAGTGVAGFSGDGASANLAQLNTAIALAIDASGNVFIADFVNYRIRKVCVGSCLAGINSLTENNGVLIFPNPNNGSFKIQIAAEIANVELILYNSLGQKVHEQKIIQGENNITTSGLAKGLYHYVLLQNKQRTSKGKLIIE